MKNLRLGFLKNPNDVKVWIDYMELVNKYAKGIDEVSVLFYRAITSDRKGSVDDPRWVSI